MTAEVAEKAPRDVLLEAADLIETRGLAKGGFVDDKGCYCTYGALYRAKLGTVAGHSGQVIDEANAVVKVLDTSFAPFFDGEADPGAAFAVITSWNDANARTAAEVVDTLRKAAEVVA